jgi:hypothetical protein
MSDIAVTTSLDGNMQMWSLSMRSSVGDFRPFGKKSTGWCEEIRWLSPTMMAIAAAEDPTTKGTAMPHQLSLLYDVGVSGKRDGKPNVTYKLQHLDQNLPHERGIASIGSLPPANNSHFWLTGGTDKKLVLWNFAGSFAAEDDFGYSASK